MDRTDKIVWTFAIAAFIMIMIAIYMSISHQPKVVEHRVGPTPAPVIVAPVVEHVSRPVVLQTPLYSEPRTIVKEKKTTVIVMPSASRKPFASTFDTPRFKTEAPKIKTESSGNRGWIAPKSYTPSSTASTSSSSGSRGWGSSSAATPSSSRGWGGSSSSSGSTYSSSFSRSTYTPSSSSSSFSRSYSPSYSSGSRGWK